MYTRLGGVLLVALLLTACGGDSDPRAPTVVRVGVVDARNGIEDAQDTRDAYALLLDHLHAQSGTRHELIGAVDYPALMALFKERRVDIAYLDAAHYVAIHSRHKAHALGVREADARATAYFLVRKQEDARRMDEFKNRRIAFGPRYSAASHWMPRLYLRRQSIDADTFFQSVEYTNGARDAVKRLLAGETDIVTAAARDIEAMFKQDAGLRERLRILWETPPFISRVWATRSDFNNALGERFRWSLVSLRPSNPEHRAILDTSGGYQAAGEYLFEDLREAMAGEDELHKR